MKGAPTETERRFPVLAPVSVMCESVRTERPVEAASSIGPPSRQGMALGEGRAQALTDSASPSTSQHLGGNSHAR